MNIGYVSCGLLCICFSFRTRLSEGNHKGAFFDENLVMTLFIKSTSDTTEGIFFTLLIPLLHPISWANRLGVLALHLAGIFVALLCTNDPFIVPIPAMQCLIGTLEAFITWCRAYHLNLIQPGRLLLGQFRWLGGKNLETHQLLGNHDLLENAVI
jgi:hypothetical protein